MRLRRAAAAAGSAGYQDRSSLPIASQQAFHRQLEKARGGAAITARSRFHAGLFGYKRRKAYPILRLPG